MYAYIHIHNGCGSPTRTAPTTPNSRLCKCVEYNTYNSCSRLWKCPHVSVWTNLEAAGGPLKARG